MDQILEITDGSFKYILLLFNFMTIVVIYLHNRKIKKAKNNHILFVTAHPDDQTMFFRPTIQSLKDDYFIHILCLSNGGSLQRQKQLKLACENLGIVKFECVNSDKMQDGMSTKWSHDQIRQRTLKYIKENNIRAIFSFDSHGISGHLNHKQISLALSKLKSKTPEKQILKKIKESPEEAPCQIKLYTLQSVNVLRKYSGILDILISLLKDYSWITLNFISAWKAMKIYKSQFVWFRKLWVIFSRYNYINTYQRSFINVNLEGKNQ